jgi:hypothetical protein
MVDYFDVVQVPARGCRALNILRLRSTWLFTVNCRSSMTKKSRRSSKSFDGADEVASAVKRYITGSLLSNIGGWS